MTRGHHPEADVAYTRSYVFRFVERDGRVFIYGPFCRRCGSPVGNWRCICKMNDSHWAMLHRGPLR